MRTAKAPPKTSERESTLNHRGTAFCEMWRRILCFCETRLKTWSDWDKSGQKPFEYKFAGDLGLKEGGTVSGNGNEMVFASLVAILEVFRGQELFLDKKSALKN